jgi:hypothetical protein
LLKPEAAKRKQAILQKEMYEFKLIKQSQDGYTIHITFLLPKTVECKQALGSSSGRGNFLQCVAIIEAITEAQHVKHAHMQLKRLLYIVNESYKP